MLQKLHIQNYAIISELLIQFPARLNIITGETGAGKSILMGALNLILGERAETNALLNREKKCVVEGWFTAEGKKDVMTFIRENDLDTEAELVIRREIAPNGKSRAFINDTPVNLEQLRELSAMLVDLHQQFDTLDLGRSDFQREVIDALAGHDSLLDNYSAAFGLSQLVKKSLAELLAQKSQFTKEFDYNKFLFDELEEANFRENELEEIEAELQMLNNAESIKSVLSKAYFELEESEQPVVQQLKMMLHQLQAFEAVHPELGAVAQRLQSAQVELKDIADEIDRISNHVQYDARRIEQINDRLTLGYKLLKKHNVKATNELLSIKNQLEEKLQAVLNIDDAIASKEKEAANLLSQATTIAEKISANRKKQVKPITEKVNALLAQVGMPNARLKVEVRGLTTLTAHGLDDIEFLFDSNKSNQFAPIRKVASGGELSRLMLCIKSLVSQSVDLPTMIFDEIDTGISGEAARQVGIILKDLAKERQVICITHQPQIAGKADAHFYVYKEIAGEAVKTNIRILNQEERITTIAKMLSGEKPTAAALENAREMVMN